MRRLQLAAICGVVILMSWPAARGVHAQLPHYTIEDLGTLNGAPLVPRAINAAGHVAGEADSGDGGSVAFLLDAQGVHDLGTLGGNLTKAAAINDNDEVVGSSVDGGTLIRAFRYSASGGMQPIDATPGELSAAFGVNRSGQVVGYAGSSELRAFHYSEGTGLVFLTTPSGSSSFGFAINESGHVTGCWRTSDGWDHAFVWDGVNPMIDLGTLGGSQSCGASINRAGQVVGSSSLAGDWSQHAFRYSPGTPGLQDLGTLGGDSAATAINDDGVVVGWYATAPGEHRAFMFTDTGGSVDLNEYIDAGPDWVLTEANGINASGQIVGIGLWRGQVTAFRLTPLRGPTPPQDTAPPRIRSVAARPPAIWPPHHEMVNVLVEVAAEDDVDPAPACRITGVASSEPDTGTSNQDRPNDVVLTAGMSLRLRAELGLQVRERTYTIGVECADASDNRATSQTTVRIVKNPWQLYR